MSAVALQLWRDGFNLQIKQVVQKAIIAHVKENGCSFREEAADVVTDKLTNYMGDLLERYEICDVASD